MTCSKKSKSKCKKSKSKSKKCKEYDVVCKKDYKKCVKNDQCWINRYLWLIGFIVIFIIIMLAILSIWRWKRYQQ